MIGIVPPIVRVAAVALCLSTAATAVAQQRPGGAEVPQRGQTDVPQRGQRGQPDAEPAPREDYFTEEDCRNLPGGNAPLRRLARIDGRLSVRNLELTYFGKPLHKLTTDDFDYLKRLIPFCDGTDEQIAAAMIGRLQTLVEEAKATRQRSLDWIKASIAKLDAMPPGGDAIQLAHNLWTEMLNREQEMMPSDLRFFADYLTRRRQLLYDGGATNRRVLVDPFVPPDPADGG